MHTQKLTGARFEEADPDVQGLTFNPQIISVELWHHLDGLSRCATELPLCRAIRTPGRLIAVNIPAPVCTLATTRA